MKNFVKMSKYAGMREDLVQAGGGNSAFKINKNKMVIKASGFQLADVTQKDGYAIVNPQVIREAFLNCENLDLMTEEMSKTILRDAFIDGARPSIETFLHSISGKYSLHTHPVAVNALTCRRNGKEDISKLFPEALIVPYATPGIELAKAYFKAYKEYMLKNTNEPQLVFLMNHGFLTSAETADEVIEITEKVTRKIEKYLRVDFEAYHAIQELDTLFEGGVIWRVTDINVLFALKKLGGAWKHYFCPDCVVFLGKQIYTINKKCPDKNDFDEFVEKNGYPTVIIWNDKVYIHTDSVKKAMEIQSVLSFSAQVMKINEGLECDVLSEAEKDLLLNWDAEKYRKNIK